MNVYSQWFYDQGWMLIAAVGASLGWSFGLKAYLFVLPAIFLAIMGEIK